MKPQAVPAASTPWQGCHCRYAVSVQPVASASNCMYAGVNSCSCRRMRTCHAYCLMMPDTGNHLLTLFETVYMFHCVLQMRSFRSLVWILRLSGHSCTPTAAAEQHQRLQPLVTTPVLALPLPLEVLLMYRQTALSAQGTIQTFRHRATALKRQQQASQLKVAAYKLSQGFGMPSKTWSKPHQPPA